MKKLLAVAILLPILSFSYEINFNKSFSKVVNPDLLTTNINISVEKKDEKSVNIEVEKFNNFLIQNGKNRVFLCFNIDYWNRSIRTIQNWRCAV